MKRALQDGADPNWLNPKDEMASLPLHYAAGQAPHDSTVVPLHPRRYSEGYSHCDVITGLCRGGAASGRV